MEKWTLLKFLKNDENNSLCFYKCFGELGYHKGKLKGFSSESKPSIMVFAMHSIREFYKISG